MRPTNKEGTKSEMVLIFYANNSEKIRNKVRMMHLFQSLGNTEKWLVIKYIMHHQKMKKKLNSRVSKLESSFPGNNCSEWMMQHNETDLQKSDLQYYHIRSSSNPNQILI